VFQSKAAEGATARGKLYTMDFFILWTSLYCGLRVCSQQIIIPYIKSWVTTTCWSCIAVPSIRDGKSIYYHGTYELCDNAGGSQKLFIFILKLYFYTAKQREKTTSRREREISLAYSLRACLSWSFVLTRCCVLTWVIKNLIRLYLMFTRALFGPRAAGSHPLVVGFDFKTSE